MSDELQSRDDSPAQIPELEREQRRLERVRLVSQLRPVPDRVDDADPTPPEAA
jgi:hypothetical protein